MIIIGITGTLGAGKGTLVERLLAKGFRHYSARSFIEEEVALRGLTSNRDNTTSVANDLRKQFGPHFIAESLYGRARADGVDAVIESLRAPAEVEYLRKKGFFELWAIDALPRRRYVWVSKRGSALDNISYEKFLADEDREMHSNDPTKQNLSACIALANVVFRNDSTKEGLWQKVDKELDRIRNSVYNSD